MMWTDCTRRFGVKHAEGELIIVVYSTRTGEDGQPCVAVTFTADRVEGSLYDLERVRRTIDKAFRYVEAERKRLGLSPVHEDRQATPKLLRTSKEVTRENPKTKPAQPDHEPESPT